MAKYDVFISYRREGGYDTAKHLYDLLTRDGYRVSFDIDTLRNGDFDVSLLKRIDECADFILIVDTHAFDRTLDYNFNPNNDWLRQELAYALKKKKNIIPIFLSGVSGFPKNLPKDIAAVTRKNGPEYNRYYFNEFYEQLKHRFLHSKGFKKWHKLLLIFVILCFLIVGTLMGYIYSPIEKTDYPISEYDDDIMVSLPAFYNKNITEVLDEAVPYELLFAYSDSVDMSYNTILVIEDYCDYDTEDLGLETEEQLQSLLDNIMVMSDRSFEDYYSRSITIQMPELKLAEEIKRIECNGLTWFIFHFQSETMDQYNVVTRIEPLCHMIFSMKMRRKNIVSDYRNKAIFNNTLETLMPKLVDYIIED